MGRNVKTENTGKTALAFIDRYEDICKDLLNGQTTNISAYKCFDLHNHKNKDLLMKGFGPAFYTKLIYFLGDHEGLIMDQWTAKSVNMLCNDKIVKLDSSGYVSKRNKETTYIKFIEILKKLQIELAMDSLSETEALIFSTSRKVNRTGLSLDQNLVASEWRHFLIENYK